MRLSEQWLKHRLVARLRASAGDGELPLRRRRFQSAGQRAVWAVRSKPSARRQLPGSVPTFDQAQDSKVADVGRPELLLTIFGFRDSAEGRFFVRAQLSTQTTV